MDRESSPEMLHDLECWYASNCDGDWEHDFGVGIETLDNPGWSVTIDLEGTNLEGIAYETLERNKSEVDWVRCWVEGKHFRGVGDPTKLREILRVFVEWAKASKQDRLRPPDPPSEAERQQAEDEAFWASLGSEIGSEICTEPGCTKKRINLSVKCRRHHFEMVTGRVARWKDG
jgi:hypothetical protein